MRVISGKYRSRKLFGYDIDGIRPTKDSVKESMFDMVRNYVDDSICLDLFAGTGALGIEALSNGAKSVYFVDESKNAINVINKNLESFKATDGVKVLNDNYTNAIKYFSNNNITFDIIFIDPPYGVITIEQVISNILKKGILSNDGIVICEYENESLKEEYNNLRLLKYKKYGKTYLSIYKMDEK